MILKLIQNILDQPDD